MNSTIQKRIDAIQRGETPKGYKKTKWGIIPDSWEATTLGDVLTERKEKKQHRILTICSVAVIKGVVDQIEHLGRSYAASDTSNYNVVKFGDIVYTKSPTGDFPFGIVKQSRLKDDVAVSPLYGVFVPNSYALGVILHCFFEYPINTNNYLAPIIQKGAKNTINITNETFLSNQVILPPLPEQEAIAEILTQQDRLIDLKHRLILEKRRQKKYLMQTLLTGKIRLPGFKEKWKNVRLRNATERIVEQVGERDIEVLSISANIGFVNQAEKFGRQIAGAQYRKYTVLHRHDFSYNKGNSKNYPQGCIYPLEDRDIGAVPDVFISFRFKNECNYMFYKQLFLHGYLNKQLYRLINFGVRNDGLLNINEKEFYNVTIPLPPLPEQEAIAEILSTADEELSLLEQELEQEKLRKKALMQMLLTGLVRVEEL